MEAYSVPRDPLEPHPPVLGPLDLGLRLSPLTRNVRLVPFQHDGLGPPVSICWRRGIVVSDIRRMNEVNSRQARLLLGCVTVFGWVYHLGM